MSKPKPFVCSFRAAWPGSLLYFFGKTCRPRNECGHFSPRHRPHLAHYDRGSQNIIGIAVISFAGSTPKGGQGSHDRGLSGTIHALCMGGVPWISTTIAGLFFL